MNIRSLDPNEQLLSLYGDSSIKGFSTLDTSKDNREIYNTMNTTSKGTEMFSYQSPYLKPVNNENMKNRSFDISPIPLNPNLQFEAHDTLFTSEIDIVDFQDQKENHFKPEALLDNFSTQERKEIRNLEKIKNMNVFNLEKDILKIGSSRFKRGLKMYKDGLFFSTNMNGRHESGLSGFTGYALFWYKTGDFYIGSWLRGLPHGWGYFYFINNGLYFGEIRGGMANGKGLYHKPEKDFYYEGEFDSGEMSGKGIIVYKKQGYEVKMNNGKIAFSEVLSADCFHHKIAPQDISSHEDEFEYLSMWLNPLTKTYMENFLYNAKRRNKFWKKIYFGEREGKIKHGAGTIFRCDGSRFHGMFYDNKAMGLGLSVDSQNNFELGFYRNKRVQIFGVNFLVNGDIYMGGFKNGSYSGPGVCYNENLNRWLFGYFENGEVSQPGINRSGKFKREHYYMGDFINVLLVSAFGSFQKSKKKLGKLVMNESHDLFDGIGNSNNRKLEGNNRDKVLYENKFFITKWKNYFQGESPLAEKKKIFGPEWEAQKAERDANSKYDLKLNLEKITPPIKKKKFEPDYDLDDACHSPHKKYHDNYNMVTTFDQNNTNLELSNINPYHLNDFTRPMSVNDTEKEELSRNSFNNELHFIRETNRRKEKLVIHHTESLSSQRSRDISRSLERKNEIISIKYPPKVKKRYQYKEKEGSQKTTNYSRNGTNGEKVNSDGVGDPLSSDRGMRIDRRKNFESSRNHNETPVKRSEKKGYESLAANFETKSIGSGSDDFNLSDCMSMGDEQDPYF